MMHVRPAPASLRILHVLNHSHRLNGNVHAAVDLACAQARLGHRVTLCSGGGDFDDLLRANGVAVVRIDQSRRPRVLASAVPALARLCGRSDVVHAHMVASAVLAWPGCLRHRVPLVTTVHNAFARSAVAMGLGRRVIAVSAAVARSMAGRGIPARRLRVVLNGTIGAARFADPPTRAPRTGAPSLLFVGGLHARKGVADLIDAFGIVHAAHPSARLTLVGEGPGAQAYRARAGALRAPDAVVFAGSHPDPRPFLAAADIFVLPSLADPAPLVLSEAREAGCAIVATDVDGIPELLEGGRAGLLVPPGDPARLAAAILPLLADPAELARWRGNSQIDIQRLGIARVARETVAVYAECARPSGSPVPSAPAGPPPPIPAGGTAGRPDGPVPPSPPPAHRDDAPASPGRMEVCLIYATYGRPEVLSRTFAAIAGQTVRPASVLVSCVKASDAGTLAERADVRILIGPKGTSCQRNRGLAAVPASADVVVFFDDDFVPHPRWIEAVVDVFRTRPEVGAVTGDLIADDIKGPGLSVEAAFALVAGGTPPRARTEEAHSPYGCNMAFRRAMIDDLRFDERLVLYGWLEDRDFGAGLARRGGAAVKSGAATGVHMGVKRGRSPGIQLGYSQVVNPIYLTRKGSMRAGLAARHIFGNVASNLAKAVRPEPYIDRAGRLRGNLLGLLDVLRGRIVPERAVTL